MPSLNDASRRHALYYKNVLSDATALYLQGHADIKRGLDIYDIERTNIEKGQAWGLRPKLINIIKQAQLCTEFPEAGVHILGLRLNPLMRIQWLEAAIISARHLDLRQEEGEHLGNLGVAYADLGDLNQAIECYKQALSIAKCLDHKLNEAIILGNLGYAYLVLGDPSHAMETFSKSDDACPRGS